MQRCGRCRVAVRLGPTEVALRPRSPSSQPGASRIEWKFDFSCREWMDCLVECEQLGSAGSLWCNMFSGGQQTQARERPFAPDRATLQIHSIMCTFSFRVSWVPSALGTDETEAGWPRGGFTASCPPDEDQPRAALSRHLCLDGIRGLRRVAARGHLDRRRRPCPGWSIPAPGDNKSFRHRCIQPNKLKTAKFDIVPHSAIRLAVMRYARFPLSLGVDREQRPLGSDLVGDLRY